MSIAWVKKNSKPLMSKYQCPVIENDFNDLMRNIMHNVPENESKLETLLLTKGFFSAEQAAQILSVFSRPKDKLKCMMILEPKLISMTCQQARSILCTFTIHEDRLEALQFVRKCLIDGNSQEGLDYVLSCFTFDDHKIAALKSLYSVVPRRGVEIAAGGHMGYSPLGTLYTNSAPNNIHFYGNSIEQVEKFPNHSLKTNTTVERVESFPEELMYQSNNPNYHVKLETNVHGRSEYLSPYKII